MPNRFTPETARAAVDHADCPLCPIVDRIAGADRRALAHLADMDKPAVYFATFTDEDDRSTYIGMTGCARTRPAAPHLDGADHVYLISETLNRLDRRDLMVLERSSYAWFERLEGYFPGRQLRPLAEAVGQQRFAQLQAFLSAAFLTIQAEGWAFDNVTPGDLSRHPAAYDEVAMVPSHAVTASGEQVELDRVGIRARGVWMGEEQGLLLYPRSTIRREIVPSAPKIVGARREELVHTGHLSLDAWGDYRVDRMLWFPNLTAAGEFVTGSSAGLRNWQVVSRYQPAATWVAPTLGRGAAMKPPPDRQPPPRR